MSDRIDQIREEARERLQSAETSEEVEEVRIDYLGRNGVLSDLFSSIPELPPDQRADFGREANALKEHLQELVEEAAERLAASAGESSEPAFDPTLPGSPPPLGHTHPLSTTIEEMCEVFRTLGFDVVEGPEVEHSWYNFEALNIPADHPSRDDFDTFYVSEDVLLRSQTSTVQIRTMEKTQPPIRIIAPGRCFRPDTEDARHSAMFHQVEGLMVGEGVNFGDLKAVLHMFAEEFFHEDTEVRFRPSFFPFTEPSAEVDCTCPSCGGSGCSTCSYSGWLELLGAGMVDPNVFDAVGYDAERYTGFAFGMGIERLAMLRYGIDDIRLFYQGDVRFLRQF
ncbi:MAG: phenylalanine--tRNA ligase subunit alpha [Candidatus Brocadiia bacterium]